MPQLYHPTTKKPHQVDYSQVNDLRKSGWTDKVVVPTAPKPAEKPAPKPAPVKPAPKPTPK